MRPRWYGLPSLECARTEALCTLPRYLIMRHISKKESNHGSIRSERYSQEKGLGLAWVEYRKIALLIDRIRDAPIPGMHRLIKFRSTRAEIIGAARFPTRPVQPVGREGGECLSGVGF
jgi:hypothetical protein